LSADQTAAARGQRPRTIDPESAAQTQKLLGSERGGWFNEIVEFQLLEHEEGRKLEYIPPGMADTITDYIKSHEL